MPILESAAAIGVAKAATSATTKVVATKLINDFNSKVVEPFFAKRKAQSALVDGVKRYLRSCEKKTRFVPTIAIQGSKFALDDVYEPLILVRTEDRREFRVADFPALVFEGSSCVLITDSAGMGKSTLSKYVFRRSLVELQHIPVLVELRRIRPGQSVLSFIADEMIGENATDACKRKLLDSFSHGGFLFIFDGYDEIDDAIRQSISGDISSISSDYSDCLFWLTSRPDAGLASFAGYVEYRIKPLSEEQAHSLLRRYDAGRGKADALIGKLGGAAQLSEFLGNPLLVTLLYKAYDYKATIPLKRNIFFRQVYEALYQDHDLAKDGTFERRKKSSLDSDDFHKAMRALGIVTFKIGRVQYRAEEFSELLSEAAYLVSPLKIEVGKWKSDLLSAVPIFMKDGTDIRWSHKAFQDYFAAQFVFFDMGVRREEFVRRVLADDNPQKNENILVLLAELDVEVVRAGYIRTYVSELLHSAEEAGATGSEVDFALFMALRCGEFFVLTPEFHLQKMLTNFEKFPDFLQFVKEKLGRDIPFRQANMSPLAPNMVLGVFKDDFAPRQQLLARIDPGTFSPPAFLGEFDRKNDVALIEGLAHDGWFNINDALVNSADEQTKQSLARLAARCVRWGMPSLASLKAVLGEDQSKRRAASIDDLLNGL